MEIDAMNVQEIARGFPKDGTQPELGMIDNCHAVRAFERGFRLLLKRERQGLAIPVSEREAQAILGSTIRDGQPRDYWLAVGHSSDGEAVFALS